ncbi:hypothetical protein [Proteus vulgaris]|uniref:hypothetical protein n=1 Tax=Proteus vulgaris TaxID=585 RepID=UPI0028897F4B|nr:hypothetical protein [Proteus vulgaris]
MMTLENLSIGELALIEKNMPEIGGFPSRVLALQNGYQSWTERLYKDLNQIIKDVIFPSASYRQNDKEDRFNLDIAGALKMMGYQASHDRWNNGHPDIYVESPGYGYKWSAESKIHSDYKYLLEGFKQICERYSSGFSNEDTGAILIITKNVDIKSLMEKWQELLSQDEDYKRKKVTVSKCDNSYCFTSKHTHSVSGTTFDVRHIPISIKFNPIDKSARNRKQQ